MSPKDHVLREVVNNLRDIAIEFHGAGQLRERLRGALAPLLVPAVVKQSLTPDSTIKDGLMVRAHSSGISGELNPLNSLSGLQSVAQEPRPFMYAIKCPDGTAYLDEHCVAADEVSLYLEVNGLNDSPDTGYSIVPLYLAAPVVLQDSIDTARLKWLCQSGARIAWSMDGEYCAVWLPDERDGTESRPAEGYPLKCYDSWSRAIDAAIAAKAVQP